MSVISGGGANLFIASGKTQKWILTWPDIGWRGNTLIQPQPLATDASLTSPPPSVRKNRDGTYSIDFTVTNNGPADTLFNVQVSCT